jgi:hypothetical protein
MPQGTKSSKFHFREVDCVIYFPSNGNENRDYVRYGVAYVDRRKKESQPGRRIYLNEVLNEPSIKNNFPHTVGYYLESFGTGPNYTPRYIETRTIKNPEEFFRFLSDLGI